MTIVSISRELGSGGNAIAAAVAKALNFEFVDRENSLEAAQAHGVSEEKIAAADEQHLSVWQRFNEERRRYLDLHRGSLSDVRGAGECGHIRSRRALFFRRSATRSR